MERIGGLWGGKNRSNFIPQITQPKYPDASLPFLGPLLLNNTSQGPKKRISRCHGPSSWDEEISSLHVVNLSVGNAISKRASKRWSTCAVNQSGMFFLTNMF